MILTLKISTAVLRFCMEEGKRKAAFTIGVKRDANALVLFVCLVAFNNIFSIIPILNKFPVCLFLLFVFSLCYHNLTSFAQGAGRIKELAFLGVISSIVLLGASVLFLTVYDLGLKGYFVANILSYLVPGIWLGIKVRIWNYFEVGVHVEKLKKEMLAYSKPLLLDTMSWWITNSSDRYIVTWLCGEAENGIYSVAYKIPSILNIFQSIFNQAWTLSAVKEFKEDNLEFYTKVYQTYNSCMVLTCSVLILFDKPLAKILFAKEFYPAWRYAPFLMISVVLGAVCGYVSGIFAAAKQVRNIAFSTVAGAVANIVGNMILVQRFGAAGAAFSTMLSYFIVWGIRIKKVKDVMNIYVNYRRDFLTYILLFIQAVLYLVVSGVYLYVGELLVIIFLLLCYGREIQGIYKDLGRRKNEK